ncbi:hypothetical protein Vafri_20882 [Volvox africanus]|uniref:Retrovirus-related Pol polyprotein from transposon TNT 1-94 n=2 Tax=Volvox africanus TaxID=51714 RepID=A0A8J4FB36_9CHLO|nr:hypothetical protein Vafri_20882 [Volvox africanus]
MGKDRLDEPLDLHNYSTWKLRFQLLCAELGYSRALLQAPIAEADVIMSDKVKSVMAKNVKNHHLQTIVRAANAKAAWDALAATFASTCNTRKVALRQELSDFKMENGEELPVYISRARQLQSDLLETGHVVSDAELSIIVIKGLPSKYHVVTTALTMREGELDFNQVVTRLMAYVLPEDDKKDSSAFITHRSGGNASSSGGKGSRPNSKSNATCHYCGKPGHFIRECKKRLADQKQGNYGRSVGNLQRREPIKMAYAVGSESRLDAWHLDSASEWHITYDVSELEDVRAVKPEEIFTVVGYDGSKHQPTHIGRYTMWSNTVKGLKIELNNVYVVPKATVKLISAGIFDERGAMIVLGHDKALVQAEGRTILRADKVGRLYAIRYNPAGCLASKGRSCAAVGSGNSKAALWHRRLGHLGYTSLERMCRENMVTGMEVDHASLEAASSRVCEPCIYGKHTRGPFPSTGHKAVKPLGLIHLDVCGPMPETSLGGSRYVTTLLDDCTGFSTVAFTETKDMVAKKVKTMIEALENITGRRVKEVRTDRGTEFLNSAMGTYFGEKGIIHGTTVGYSPEQNGAAERLNRTLLEKTRAMLAESGLPLKLWAEAMATANLLRNVSPVVGMAVTPYEAFTGTKPDISHLRVFGCAAYAHVPKEKRNKLQPVSRKGVLVGYEQGRQYRILFDDIIGIHSAVKFDETVVGGSHEDSDDDPEEVTEEAGGVPPPGGGGGTLANTGMELGTAEVNRGASTSGSQMAVPQRHRGMPPTQFPRTQNAEQLHEGGGGPSTGGGGQAQQQDGDGDTPMQDRRYPLRERKRLIEWRHEPNGRVTFGRINAAIIEEVPEPATYQEATNGPNAEEWRRAMDEEITAQLTNGTWELAKPPPGARILPCRWVYKIKRAEDGGIERFKARLVAKGYEQRAGIDYGEVFAPTSRFASLRTLLAVAAAKGMQIHQLDVSTAFLNGELEEELWMEQPPGYESADPEQACRLLRSIYGLKQAPHCWYVKLVTELDKLGFKPSKSDPALFIKKDEKEIVYLLIHVDDFLTTSSDEELIKKVKAAIGEVFKIRDLGEAKVFLEMEISRGVNGEVKLSQQRYIEALLQRHQLVDAKPRTTPLPPGSRVLPAEDGDTELADSTKYRALIGELNYLATSTRPDIAQAMSVLARFMEKPSKAHMGLALGVLRYLAGTKDIGLCFGGGRELTMAGYSDSDWAGDPATRRSTTGYVFTLGGAAISWNSQLQRTVAASSVEAEYQATSAAVREALWLRKLAGELGLGSDAIEFRTDSQGAMSLGNNPITSARSKHIDVQHHLVRERVSRREVALSYCSTEDMVADVLTKALGEIKFKKCIKAMGLAK